MINTCINKNSTFFDALSQFTSEEKAQITDKLNQPEFLKWYGKGEVDSFGQPKIVNEIYIVNDKREKITLKDLLNDEFYKKRQNYTKDLTSLDKIKNFIKESNIDIAKRISAFRDTDYAEKLQNLLDYLNKLEENNHLEGLIAYHDYMVKTLEDFEMRFHNYDRNKGTQASKEDDRNFKNFLTHSSNFLQSFSKVRNLDFPVIETSEEKEVIENLKKLETRVNDLTNRTNAEIEAITRDVLDQYISNPEVKAGIIDFLAAQTDESKVQLLLDALGDSHVTFLAGIDKFFKRAMYDKDQEVRKLTKEWDKFIKDFNGNFDTFLNRVLEKKDGKNTGRFVQKYNEEYYNTIYNHINKLNTLKSEGKENTQEYVDTLGEYYTWKKENTEQKYKKEYYDSLNILIPKARKAKEEIDTQKTDILSKGINKLTVDDFERLRELDSDMKWVKSTVNKDGSSKVGEDLEIAKSLFKYSKQMANFYYTKGVNEKGFNKAKKEAQERGNEDFEKWLKNNTKETFHDDFWNFFKKLIARLPNSEELEAVNDEIKQLTIGFRNNKNEIKVSELPKDLKAKIDQLEGKKEVIKAQLREKMSLIERREIAKEFEKHIVFEPTSQYLKKFSEMNQKLSEQEYKKWYDANHTMNLYTEKIEPISMWTVMRPRNKKFIINKPNNLWNITDIKSEFINPNFDVDNNGYPNPTDNWISDDYKKLSPDDLTKLEEIQDKLLYLTEHTKNDIIKKGYLPSIPKDNRSAFDILTNKSIPKEETFQEVAVTESEDIVKFIPFKYVRKLNQTAKPESIPEGATKEEIERIEKANEELRKANKSSHAEALDYNLTETMKTFIKSALNHKYKSAIEVDLKLFKEQLKRQKIKVTNAKGDKLYDKIKTKLSGEKTEYEVSALGSNTEKHFNEWLDAVFYEDFELDEGVLSDWTKKIQDFTSLRALGFNVLSAVNNKLIGNIQERIEAAGGTYFKYSDYREARKRYTSNMISYVSNHKTKNSNNFIDAFIKDFDVLISQDEIASRPDSKIKTLLYKARAVRDTAFFMQHLGEHQIQNATLLAMSNSHRIINGKIMNFTEFWEGKKAEISFNKNMTDAELDEQISNINKNYELKKALDEEFESYPKLIDSYELKDGYNILKSDIKLDKNEIFNFRERVIGINQRLHGIYNTEDAALLQRNALGRLAMQFRKWMRPGWNRRFGNKFGQKVYNERIRDYEEGIYVSAFKYVFNPAISNWKAFRKQEEKTAIKAFKMILDSIKDTFTDARIRWNILSEVEKAGVKKTAAEFLFLISVIALGFAAKSLKGDDDDKSLTFTLYQADRLFGELTTFTPIGLVREGNRLFSSPSPVFNTFEDIFKLGSNIFLYPFRDEEERKFKTGIYHGEDKVGIYLGDMLPVYNQIQRIKYLGEQNERYGLFK